MRPESRLHGNLDVETYSLDLPAEEPRGWRRFYRDRAEFLLGAAAVVAFLVLWELLSANGLLNPLFVSSPSAIYDKWLAELRDGTYWHDLSVSGYEFGLGYLLSVVLGVPAGIVTGWYRKVNAISNPFVMALYATPRIALMPLVIIWLGIGVNSKVAIVFLGAVFPILVNMQTAMRTLDESILKAAHSFGANNAQIFRTVALPSAVPYLITGLRLGVGRALVGIVVGELYAATAGIGYRLTVAGATFDTPAVFVGVLTLAAAGVFFDWSLRAVERRFDAWRPQHTGG